MFRYVAGAQLTLENGTDNITIRQRHPNAGDPVYCRAYDLGSPDMRYQATPNPGADGVTESTGYLGSRQVTLDLQIVGGTDPLTKTTHDAYWYVSRLARMAHPSANPVLFISRNDELSNHPLRFKWRMVLRGSPYTLTYTRTSAAVIEMQLVFVCPLGLLESELYPYTSTPPSMGVRTDWIFPATFRKGFGLIGNTYPQMIVPVYGDAAVQPTIYINGPCTNPDLRCGDDRFKFNGLTLAAGQMVKIDMASGDIVVSNTDGSEVANDMSAYALVDWSVSTYWIWPPGDHQVIFYSATGSLRIDVTERRMTI